MNDRARYALSAKEAAAYLGLAVVTLYKIAEAGNIDHLRSSVNVHTRMVQGKPQTYRKHGRLKFSLAGLDVWIAAHRAPLAPASVRQAAPRLASTLPSPARRRFA